MDTKSSKQKINDLPEVLMFKEEPFQINDCNEFKLTSCRSFRELSQRLASEPEMLVICSKLIQKNGTANEFLLMLDTLIRYTAPATYRPIIAISIQQDTPSAYVKELQKTVIAGIIPESACFGVDESCRALHSLLSSKTYWPKHIIQQLPGNKVPQAKFKDVHLTARQQQVFDLIAQRGLSNKQIASVLKISESTVKIHVSAVMKNMCVRNRTQLALIK